MGEEIRPRIQAVMKAILPLITLAALLIGNGITAGLAACETKELRCE